MNPYIEPSVQELELRIDRLKKVNAELLEALEKIHNAGLAAIGYKDSPLGKQVQSAINKAKGQ